MILAQVEPFPSPAFKVPRPFRATSLKGFLYFLGQYPSQGSWDLLH
jgi:hypothetical protein